MELIAKIREKTGKKAKVLRQQGITPAILCRKGKQSISIEINSGDFLKIYNEAGETGVIQLKIMDGDKQEKPKNVLISEFARNPLSGDIIHVDFQEIRMDEKLTASVPLVFIGESLLIKGEGGTLVRNIKEVEVKALAKDLPRHIEVDISKLETFESRIHISDLSVSDSVQILADQNETVALIAPPRKEEVVTEAPTAEEKPLETPTGEEVAVEKKQATE